MAYLTTKELADKLRHSADYVYAMRRRGFEMPGGTATVDEARDWLRANGGPRAQKRAKTRKNA